MASHPIDTDFSGSIPELYDRLFVPLIFQCYADDLAARVAALSPASVLEIAAGSGVVTRALASALPPSTRIVATDLNQPMVDHAASVAIARPVEWRQADALALPFDDATFDVVVCQFGAMFFPDKPAAYAEARRVLRPGGTFVFSVWDAIEHNEFADVLTQAIVAEFPDNPPRFLARTPHGYSDPDAIRRDLAAGGFTAPPEIIVRADRSVAASARDAAVAYCYGSPVRSDASLRDPSRIERATNAATAALARRFGAGKIDGKIQALIVIQPRDPQ